MPQIPYSSGLGDTPRHVPHHLLEVSSGLTWSKIKLLIISRWRQHSGKCALLGTGAQDALRSPPCFLTIILLFHLFSFFFYFLLFLAKASVDFVMYDWESFDRQV